MHEESNQNEKNEKEEPIIEEASWEKPDYLFVPKGNHQYKQQGYYLICYSCDLSHAVFLGKDRVMVGEDSSGPIIKKRKEIGLA